MTAPQAPNYGNMTREMSWTRVTGSNKDFPTNRRCMGPCQQIVKRGEYVITIPVRHAGEFLTAMVVHKECMAGFLKDVPDSISTLREKADRIKERFVSAE